MKRFRFARKPGAVSTSFPGSSLLRRPSRRGLWEGGLGSSFGTAQSKITNKREGREMHFLVRVQFLSFFYTLCQKASPNFPQLSEESDTVDDGVKHDSTSEFMEDIQ